MIRDWTTEEVESWLRSCGFERFIDLFCSIHEIDGKSLLALTENDLRLPPLQLTKLGDIKKLGMGLEELQEENRREETAAHTASAQKNSKFLAPPTTRRRRRHRHDNGSTPTVRINQSLYSESESTSADDQSDALVEPSQRKIVFDPEYGKTFASFIYAVCAMFMTAYTMVVVHDRVPDKNKHPPLPDIFLDNVPRIPYAFKLAELCGIVLMAIWAVILVFHKHRWILLRRMYSIISTVFLLRCITMFVTSLAVPGDHLQCQSARYSATYERLTRALEIFVGGGMTLSGIHTCGDYMFSGHTVVLTIFNHLITEYTPIRWYSLHIASWVFNLFGIFFILAAHEHYSIDVVIAFYITSRIFLYYHMLANTRSYMHSKRIRIWFPLLSYFECNVPGKVPNVYEWPLSIKKIKNFCNHSVKWILSLKS